MEAGDFFELDLPSGIAFTAPLSGVLLSKGVQFATWSITEEGKLLVTLTQGVKDLTTEIWGSFGFEGAFEYLEDAEEGSEKTEVLFGDQKVEIERREQENDPKPPAQSSLSKSYVYDAESNELVWTVVVTPPEDEEDPDNYDYSGFTLTDKMTGNHTFVSGSYKQNSVAVADSELVISASQKEVSYTFPEGTKGEQVIR